MDIVNRYNKTFKLEKKSISELDEKVNQGYFSKISKKERTVEDFAFNKSSNHHYNANKIKTK